ncbi:MAG: RHS repeat protein [Caldilineaceae bacterium]|nr:RHS repeat protein [Caldilineaceae bacterium]
MQRSNARTADPIAVQAQHQEFNNEESAVTLDAEQTDPWVEPDGPASLSQNLFLPLLSYPDRNTNAQSTITAQAAANSWAVGNIVGLNCNTEIRTGSGDAYPIHTYAPYDGYEVLVKGGPRFADGQTWWDIDRQAVTGDPGDGTGWISQEQSEGASCDGGGGDPPVIWAPGATIGLCTGTEIRHGPELAIHTIVPEDSWNIVVIDGPRIVNGQTWWDTSRFLAGDPTGGTGWVSQEQAEEICVSGGGSLFYLGPLPLDPAMRALFFELGHRLYQLPGLDPVNMATGNFIQEATDMQVPGVAGFDLVIKRTYNSFDDRDGVFGTGWSSLLDTRLRIANDGSVDARYGDGRGAYFVLNGDVYEPGQEGIFDELTYVAPGFELITVDQMTYEFDQQGYLMAYRDRHGNTITIERDGDHHITRIIDSGDRVFPVTYDGEHIASITDPIGRVLGYAYTDDNLAAFTDGNGGVHGYGYDGEHRLTQLTDPEGILFLQNIYDGEGRVVEQVDAGGSHSFITYSGDGTNTTTDNLGNQTRYIHDDLNRVVQIEDALGQSVYYTYDDSYNRT